MIVLLIAAWVASPKAKTSVMSPVGMSNIVDNAPPSHSDTCGARVRLIIGMLGRTSQSMRSSGSPADGSIWDRTERV